MKVHYKSRQRGVTFVGLVFVGAVVAMAGVGAAQAFPPVVVLMAVQKAVSRAAEGQSVADIRNLFDKQASIDDIKSISGKDIDVSKEGEKVVVSFSYQREIHLAGPAYLTLKYAGRSK